MSKKPRKIVNPTQPPHPAPDPVPPPPQDPPNMAEIDGMIGCSDHHCDFGHPGGMGTNGGCACMKVVPQEMRIRIRRNVYLLRKALRERKRYVQHLPFCDVAVPRATGSGVCNCGLAKLTT